MLRTKSVGFGGHRFRKDAEGQTKRAPRKPRFEQDLCSAVGSRLLVEFRYDEDKDLRLFAPHVVYRTPDGRINVGGSERSDQKADLVAATEPTLYDIGRMSSLRVCEDQFQPDGNFDRSSPLYNDAVICSV